VASNDIEKILQLYGTRHVLEQLSDTTLVEQSIDLLNRLSVEIVWRRCGGAAVNAEDRVWIDRAAACWARWAGVAAENLTGDIGGLLRVKAANAAWHKERVDEAEDGRDTGPG
jgi:hypothetical protein